MAIVFDNRECGYVSSSYIFHFNLIFHFNFSSLDNQVSRILVSRRGFYGNVTVFINDGFPSGKYSGFTKGLVKPSVSQVTFAGNEVEKEFSAKVFVCIYKIMNCICNK